VEQTVFYSWQSDLPNATNRGFIQTALEKAAKTIRNDDSIQVEPVIDRDTAGVPGAPDIAHTIFEKIDKASVFVCDISIIYRVGKSSKKRPTPNPNVLVELGYAIKTLGWNRIIPVMNVAFGGVEQLPFDLKTKRVIGYSMHENQERADERQKLEGRLEAELREIFAHLIKEETSVVKPIETEVMDAVLTSLPNRAVPTRRYIASLINEFSSLAPDFSKEANSDEVLMAYLEKTTELVTNFSFVIETMVAAKDRICITSVYKSFDDIINKYYIPLGFSGNFRKGDFDFYKFIGHELFVTIFALLIQSEAWELITELLNTGFYVENSPKGTPQSVPFGYISQYVELLDTRKYNVISLHAYSLMARHTKGKLGELVALKPFMDADYFLFLRSEANRHDNAISINLWRPWSTAYMTEYYRPRFLVEAQSKKYAEGLLKPLGIESIEMFRALIVETIPRLVSSFSDSFRFGFNPLYEFDLNSIGSKKN
jgi:hypothetical protein